MKFKVIFALFNIVILFSLFIVTIMPVFILGVDYGGMFLQSSWYYFLIFFLVLVLLDSWFIYNWRLLSSMEEERWGDMVDILEKRTESGKIPSGYFLRIMINGYLMTSNIGGIDKLGSLVKEKKKHLYVKNILYFSIPVLLKNDPLLMESHFSSLLEDGGAKDIQWIKYLYAFSLLLQFSGTEDEIQAGLDYGNSPLMKQDRALEILSRLCMERLPLTLEILVLYSMHPFADSFGTGDEECFSLRRRALLDKYNRESLEKALKKEKGNPAVVIFSRLVNDGVDWLFGKKINLKD